MLFLGMEMLDLASEPMRVWLVREGLLAKGESVVVLLLLGMALAGITQSSTVAGAFAVAVVRVGIFDLGSALALLVGASVGSAINYGVPGLQGEAVGRKVMLFQAAQKLFGATILAILLLVTSGHPDGVLGAKGVNPATAFAWTFVAVQVCGSLACTLLFTPLSRLLDKISPPKEAEALGRPAFLLEEALADPALALDLVEREEQRLLDRLPPMLDAVRSDTARGAAGPPAEALRDAGLSVAEATRRYIAGILESEPGRLAVTRAMRLQHVLDGVAALHEAVEEFQRAVRIAIPKASEPCGRMVESLHMLLEVLGEIGRLQDAAEREMSLALMGDRRKVIEQLRERLMASSSEARVQEALFRSTVLFERILWLARDTAVALIQSTAGARETDAPPTAQVLAEEKASA
jgi:phosphate:Na+ symporter